VFCREAALPDESPEPTIPRIQSHLREVIESRAVDETFACQGELLCGVELIPGFYRRRNFRPAWVRAGAVRESAFSLIEAIREAGREGLRGADYHLEILESLLSPSSQSTENSNTRIERIADLDLLLTDAFLTYAGHLRAGRVDPATLHADWIPFHPTVDLAGVLQEALSSNQIRSALDGLRPPHPGYHRLRDALQHYRELKAAGGWPTLAPGPSLKKDDQGSRVAVLRRRLDLTVFDHSTRDRFDAALEEAVRSFQNRHGLEVDGIVGEKTRRALNVSTSKRIQQIEVNLERWRWIPHDLGEAFIQVDIAGFRLNLVEHGKHVMEMRVVVGKRYRRTPVFSSKIVYLVLNPYWNVPHRIAVRDILPKVRRDPAYLENNGFRVLESWKENAGEIDPASIDWSEIAPRNFPYRLRQDPGPGNSLGLIKFIFPNKFSVYLHDTPSQALFDRTSRDFSSGCIRIEKPIDLAEYLLSDDPRWGRERILESIKSGDTLTIRLPEPFPVHLQYWTAWVDRSGTVHFREDIYGRDQELYPALTKRPPSP